MTDKALLSTGIIGTLLTALCCFTPLLVMLLTGIGLSVVVNYLDLVLLPVLAIFVGMTLYALWRRKRREETTI